MIIDDECKGKCETTFKNTILQYHDIMFLKKNKKHVIAYINNLIL